MRFPKQTFNRAVSVIRRIRRYLHSRVVAVLRRGNIRLRDWYSGNFCWRNVPRSKPIAQINLHRSGGGQLFVRDINGDGKPEFLWLQSPGIFKSKIYKKEVVGLERDLFCLTATDTAGNVLWQIGKPYSGEVPYCSHACERMVAVGDIDRDGAVEVIVLDSQNRLLILNGGSGQTKSTMKLPADNFCTVIVEDDHAWLDGGGAAVLVGVMADAYQPYAYCNPWLFYDSNLNLLHKGEYLGAGHTVPVFRSGEDGFDGFLIGYEMVNPTGKRIWTLDFWRDREIDPMNQHVDCVAVWRDGTSWQAAIAGSDRAYCIGSDGRCLWSYPGPHPQYCLVGTYEGETRIIILNQREPASCFTADGRKLWEKRLPENWPMGRPDCAFGCRPIHTGDAAKLLRRPNRDLLVYVEGGWPYAVDFDGSPAVRFEYSLSARKPRIPFSPRRINDYGMSFEAETHDLDGDGSEELIIYDRRYAWIYKP